MKRVKLQIKQTADGNQNGAALVTSIFAILLLTVIGFALISNGLLSQNISKNAKDQTEAYYISEAGLTHATKLVTAAGPSTFTAILQAGDGTANTGDELSTRPTALTPIPAAGIALGNGNYIVKVSDDPAETDGNPNVDSNNRLLVTSTGYGQNGATVTTEAIIGVTNNALPAILVNGRLRINGNPRILGTSGIVHANSTLDFDGNPCASQYFSSSANIVDPGNSRNSACSGAGVNRANQPVITTPTWNIRTDFSTRADFILGAIGMREGKVYNSSGTALAMSGTDWIINANAKFSWDSGNKRWIHGGSQLPTGTYYSEGNLEISSDFGTSATPAQVTLIAEGYISVSGNPYMRPKLDNFSLMAGTDLRVSGNPAAGANNYQGIHYAGHQIGFSGNPAINGVIISANLADTNSPGCGCNFIPLSSGFMEISGNPTITYNGGLIGGSDTATLISWREVRF